MTTLKQKLAAKQNIKFIEEFLSRLTGKVRSFLDTEDEHLVLSEDTRLLKGNLLDSKEWFKNLVTPLAHSEFLIVNRAEAPPLYY